MLATERVSRAPRLASSSRCTSLRSSLKSTRKAAQKQQAKPLGFRTRRPVAPQALFGGGATKTSKRTAYICKDCGYIYDGREAFESLDKSYRCPVCSSPKRRFTVYNEPVAKGANNTNTRKDRKAELQASGGGLNPGIVIGIGAIVVAAAFAYLNSVY